MTEDYLEQEAPPRCAGLPDSLLQLEGRRSLKWDSYVGVIETPCGTRLEILPKHVEKDVCSKAIGNGCWIPNGNGWLPMIEPTSTG